MECGCHRKASTLMLAAMAAMPASDNLYSTMCDFCTYICGNTCDWDILHPPLGRIYIMKRGAAGRKHTRIQFKMKILTMPMGNSMPVITTCTDATGRTTSTVVDAHSMPGLTMDAAIPLISQAVPMALSSKEINVRQQIATKVQITMGGQMMHFEKDIDPRTGTVDIDWTLTPLSSELCDETRVKSHAVLRIYTEHTNSVEDRKPSTNPEMNSGASKYSTPESKFCYLTGCEAIHLPALMQHVIDVNTGKVDATKQREYDFAAQTNFCNTFNLCTVLPFDTPMTQQARTRTHIAKRKM